MIIPWGTDAPIYHWPWMTVVLIVANVLAYFGVMSLPDEAVESLVLSHGHGLHPLQWLTSNFVHWDLEHLIGNMIFLWAFALVVEGKLGAFPFLGVYLGLGIVECGLEQVLTLGMKDGGGSFGASAIIYGIMAMALVWAPKNELNCVIYFRFAPSTFDVPILVFALLYLGLEAVLVFLTGFAVTGALLHLSGAALGFALGTVLLKVDWVDCEGWDLYAVMRGRHGQPKRAGEARSVLRGPAPKPPKKSRRPKAEAASAPRTTEEKAATALQRLRAHLDADEAEAALGVYDKAVRTIADWHPPDPDWLNLIKALNAAKDWRNSVTVMEDYLRRSPAPSPRVRLKLAQILIREQQRPAHALRVLAEIPDHGLPDSLDALRKQLIKQAEHLREEGVLELEGEAW